MFGFELKRIGGIPLLFGRLVRSYRFALAAFLIPLFIRSIPEILVGPYPIGWDTIAFYVPNTQDWVTGNVSLLEKLYNAPLMYMVSAPLYLLLRVNPVWIFKVMGPFLYGAMSVALFRFLRLGLGWNGRRSLSGSLLTALYFVTLRISWDQYRSLMGLTFLLLALPLLNGLNTPRRKIALSALVVLGIAANQLPGVIMLAVLTGRALIEISRGKRSVFVEFLEISLPGASLLFSMVVAGIAAQGANPFQNQPLLPGPDVLITSIGFLGYAYLPILFVAILGISTVPSVDLRIWSLACVIGALTPLIPFQGLTIPSERWSILLDIPMCIFATAGFARLASSTRTWNAWTRVPRMILRAMPAIPLILSILYIALPAEQATPYYTAFPNFMPSSMVQDTLPMSQMTSMSKLLDWAAANMTPKTALITHRAVYGWARAYFAMPDNIVNYEYSSPYSGVEEARTLGYSRILMIWWAQGLGWNGQPSVPAGFVPLTRSGNLAVYLYA